MIHLAFRDLYLESRPRDLFSSGGECSGFLRRQDCTRRRLNCATRMAQFELSTCSLKSGSGVVIHAFCNVTWTDPRGKVDVWLA